MERERRQKKNQCSIPREREARERERIQRDGENWWTKPKKIAVTLINFRNRSITLTGDIQQMYPQIRIVREQEQLQRIIWKEDKSKKFEIFSLPTLTFGTSQSAFLATRTLKWIADNSKLTEKQKRILKDDFYVDDLLTSGIDEKTMYEKISAIKNEL
jgi:hypothetical protein